MVEPNDAKVSAPRGPGRATAHCDEIAAVAVLDDHPIICAHLRDVLRIDSGLRVVHVVQCPDILSGLLANLPCDVLILDFNLPNARLDGTQLLKSLRRNHPGMSIIVFSSGRATETRYATYRAGAHAHMSKTESPACLPRLIRATRHARDKFLYIERGELVVGEPPSPMQELTQWETETVRLLNRGLSVSQIAQRLNRSSKTISSHKRHAMGKLGLKDDVALAMYLSRMSDTLQ